MNLNEMNEKRLFKYWEQMMKIAHHEIVEMTARTGIYIEINPTICRNKYAFGMLAAQILIKMCPFLVSDSERLAHRDQLFLVECTAIISPIQYIQ